MGSRRRTLEGHWLGRLSRSKRRQLENRESTQKTRMSKPNFKSHTMWTGDNLPVMRGLNSESVDLIYLDPPFNSNRNYAAPIGSEAAGAAFKDTWTLDDVDVAWHGEIAEQNPAVYSVIQASGEAHGSSMKSYLIMMAVRLLEMLRVLKETGSIYLHCDPTASHYLKLLMDAVFGHRNFRNETIWRRTGAHGRSKQWGPLSMTPFCSIQSHRKRLSHMLKISRSKATRESEAITLLPHSTRGLKSMSLLGFADPRPVRRMRHGLCSG